jgi:pyruvate dehydrogenase E2 component (dihydrolipoamide acetyltransferase)
METLQPADILPTVGPEARTPVSPRARRLAREEGVDLAGVAGSGPRGRIVERDVRAAVAARPLPEQPAWDVLGSRPLPVAPWAPQAHLEADCHLDALEKWRIGLNESAGDETVARISLVDCVVKALALALRQIPRAHVSPAGPGFEAAVHSPIAMAMAVGGRIATPALAAAEHLALTEIATARENFMAGRLPTEGAGAASCLVIDFGDFGVKRVFPVLVAPWTLILSIGEAQDRVVVEDGAPAVAAILSVTLTLDRRAMDEIAGAMLLDAFRRLIEDPQELL